MVDSLVCFNSRILCPGNFKNNYLIRAAWIFLQRGGRMDRL